MIKNEDLHTPWRVRIIVGIIGVALLASTMALYLGVFVQYGDQGSSIDAGSMTELEERYNALSPIVSEVTSKYSAEYFDTLKGYKPEVKGFNEEALEYGVRDLKVGDGRMIESASDPYLAYYIGWKPDESILDSSFDNFEEPTSLKAPLNGSTEMIRGWLEGVVGMQIGGVREVSIPADYAYGDSALKFIIMLIPYEENDLTNIVDFNEVQTALMYAQYGQ